MFIEASRNLTDFWLSYWTESSIDPHRPINRTQNSQLTILNPSGLTHFYQADVFYISRNEESFLYGETIKTTAYFFTVYGILCLANTIFTLVRAFGFAQSGILAGKRIHKRLIENISKVGLIINRCFKISKPK